MQIFANSVIQVFNYWIILIAVKQLGFYKKILVKVIVVLDIFQIIPFANVFKSLLILECFNGC